MQVSAALAPATGAAVRGIHPAGRQWQPRACRIQQYAGRGRGRERRSTAERPSPSRPFPLRTPLTAGLACHSVRPVHCVVWCSRWLPVPETTGTGELRSRAEQPISSAHAVGRSSKNACKSRKRIMCAGLMLRGIRLNETGLRRCNPWLGQSRPLILSNAATFVLSKPGALARGQPRLNRMCNAGDECL
jgi:hypothetical protein